MAESFAVAGNAIRLTARDGAGPKAAEAEADGGRDHGSWWVPGATLGGITAAAAMLAPSMYTRGKGLNKIMGAVGGVIGFGAGTTAEMGVRAVDAGAPGDRLDTQLGVAGAGLAAATLLHAVPGKASGRMALARTASWVAAAGAGAGAAATAITREELPAGTLAQVAPGVAATAGAAALARHDMKAWARIASHTLPEAPLPAIGDVGNLLAKRSPSKIAYGAFDGATDAARIERLGKSGLRFEQWAASPAEINRVMGTTDAVQPGRAYVGMNETAKVTEKAGIEERAQLIAERAEAAILKAAKEDGGKRRYDVVTLFATTATGYVNPGALVAQEMFTGGKHLSLAIQAGNNKAIKELFNLDRTQATVARAAELLKGRMAALPEELRPREVHGYGESWGALTFDGVLGKTGLEGAKSKLGLDRLMMTGPPAKATWAERIASDAKLLEGETPKVLSVTSGTEALAIPEAKAAGATFGLLKRPSDPVGLLRLRHFWDPQHLRRGGHAEGVAQPLRWWPGASMLHLVADFQLSQYFKQGVLESRGHDYRPDVIIALRRFLGHDGVSDTQVARVREYARQVEVEYDSWQKAAAAAVPATK